MPKWRWFDLGHGLGVGDVERQRLLLVVAVLLQDHVAPLDRGVGLVRELPPETGMGPCGLAVQVDHGTIALLW